MYHKISVEIMLSDAQFKKLNQHSKREHLTIEDYITIATKYAIRNDLLNVLVKEKDK